MVVSLKTLNFPKIPLSLIAYPLLIYFAHLNRDIISDFIDGKMERQKDGYEVRRQFLQNEIKRAKERIEDKQYFFQTRYGKHKVRDGDSYFVIQKEKREKSTYTALSQLLEENSKDLKKN